MRMLTTSGRIRTSKSHEQAWRGRAAGDLVFAQHLDAIFVAHGEDIGQRVMLEALAVDDDEQQRDG